MCQKVAKSNSSFIWINLFYFLLKYQSRTRTSSVSGHIWQGKSPAEKIKGSITFYCLRLLLFISLAEGFVLDWSSSTPGKSKAPNFTSYLHLCGSSWSDSFLRTNFSTGNRLLRPRETVDGAEEGIPLRVRGMKKGQRGTEELTGISHRLCLQVNCAKQHINDERWTRREREI